MSEAPALIGMNHIKDLESANDYEKKHTPHITAEKIGDRTTVTVKVGHEVPHPNQPDHFIQWIEVYANDLPVARFDLTAVVVDPTVSCVVDLDPGTTVSAVESCNLHGFWRSEITL